MFDITELTDQKYVKRREVVFLILARYLNINPVQEFAGDKS